MGESTAGIGEAPDYLAVVHALEDGVVVIEIAVQIAVFNCFYSLQGLVVALRVKHSTGEPRTVASGIAKWYKPEELVGKSIILVSNLKPAVLCGVESCGMILAADAGEDDVKVIFVDGIPAGSKVR